MNEKIVNVARPASGAADFKTVFLTVFLVVVISGTAITFILPESYVSTAAIKIPDASAAGGVQSPAYDPDTMRSNIDLVVSAKVLDPVIDQMNLNVIWGKKFNGGQPFQTAETRDILKGRLKVGPKKNSMLVGISVYDDDSREAAAVANAIAKSYQEYQHTAGPLGSVGDVQMVETAEPGSIPARPNKPLNIIISLISGAIIGAAVAKVVSGMSAGRRQKPANI